MNLRAPAVAATLLLVLHTMVFALGAHAQETITFTHGHIDAFNVTPTPDGGLNLDLKEDVTGSQVRRDPSTVIFAVDDSAYTEGTTNLPGIERPLWFLPQAQDYSLPWVGWDTTAVRTAGFQAIDLHIVDVTGPGTIFAYQQNTFGGAQSVTTDGALWLHNQSVIRQEQPAHVHVNWGFDAPGTYTISIAATGTNSDGQGATSNTATYTWVIGSEAGADNGGVGSPDAPGNEDNAATPGAPGAPGAAPAAPGAPGASGAPKAPDAPIAPKAPGAPDKNKDGSFFNKLPSNMASSASSERSAERNRTWIVFGLGVLLLTAGGIMFWRARRWAQENKADPEEDTEAGPEGDK